MQYVRCRCCGFTFDLLVYGRDVPLDADGVCDGCRAEPETDDN